MILIDAFIFATITFVLGFFAGRLHTIYLLVKRVNQEIDKLIDVDQEIKSLIDELENPKDETVHYNDTAKCFVEEQNGTYYLYEDGTELYLAQADTMEELAQKIQKHNSIEYALVTMFKNDEKQKQVFWFHEGEVRKL